MINFENFNHANHLNYIKLDIQYTAVRFMIDSFHFTLLLGISDKCVSGDGSFRI